LAGCCGLLGLVAGVLGAGGVGGLKMEHDSELTDEQIAEAEDNQCDALCNPTFWSDGQGGVICFGCGKSVWLVKPRQKRPLTVNDGVTKERTL
jgi:hypothetical protein